MKDNATGPERTFPMTTLIASPAQRIAAQVGPDAMVGTDPYALGFCVASYDASENREVAHVRPR